MRSVLKFALESIDLQREEILLSQGIPEQAALSENFERIFKEAVKQFYDLAKPVGLTCGLDTAEFAAVFGGEGLNEKDNPVNEIFRSSSSLALFAATLGPVLSDRITGLFDCGEYAAGYMLDSVSSLAADKLANLTACSFKSDLLNAGVSSESATVLSYSPGYCGWHISGQKKLFEFLEPEEIGITLNESYLMSPVKTVSGVLIAGPAEIHEFVNSYHFCDACTTLSCIERMRNL